MPHGSRNRILPVPTLPYISLVKFKFKGLKEGMMEKIRSERPYPSTRVSSFPFQEERLFL